MFVISRYLHDDRTDQDRCGDVDDVYIVDDLRKVHVLTRASCSNAMSPPTCNCAFADDAAPRSQLAAHSLDTTSFNGDRVVITSVSNR